MADLCHSHPVPPLLHLHRPNVYTRPELQRLPMAMRLSFVTPPPLAASPHVKMLSDPHFTSFNIYPTTDTHVRLHRVLHTAANLGALPAPMLDSVFDQQVHALAFTPELFEFLATVTFEELQTAIIDFLGLLHHQLLWDADHAAVDSMHRELLPSVWQRVHAQIGFFEYGEPTSGRRSIVLEHLVQISFMTPWRVDVHAIFTPSASSSDTALKPSSNMQAPSSLLLTKLVQDWILFDSLLKPIHCTPHEVVEALERSIATSQSSHIFACIFTLLQSQFVAQLPPDVFDRLVAWLLRRSCERLPPRQRRLASLRKLLAISSQRLQEVSFETSLSVSELLLQDEDDDSSVQDDVLSTSEPQPSYPLDVLPWKRYRSVRRGL
ncbi:unnamed protein product [Agarophyton chilense]